MSLNTEFSITERSECILCASCASLAPSNFEIVDAGSTVTKQPEGIDELQQCNEALNNCPMSIIASA